MLSSQPWRPDDDDDADGLVGTLDGLGAGDHDQPYQFGRRPSAREPFPFTTHEYTCLLLLRSRLAERHAAA